MANVMNLLAVSNEQLIQWITLGVCGVIVLIAFICGAVKGFSNFSRRPVSWAFGCAAFFLLETLFHQNNFLLNLFGLTMEPALYSFISTMIWLVVALLVRWIVFGALGLMIQGSKNKKLKKAEKIEQEEKIGGEEYLPDENKPYRPLPVNGKIKPGPLNRLFGGVFAALNMAVVLALVVSLVMLIISVTPLKESLAWMYTGAMESIWTYVRTYVIDFVLIAIIVLLVRQGYRVGMVYSLRTVGVILAYIAAVVGAFIIPFTPIVQVGNLLGFMTAVGKWIAALVPAIVPIAVTKIALKVVAGILLAIALYFFVKLVAWLLDKLIELVDNVAVLTVIDGVIGAVIFFVIAVVVVALVVGVLYVLEYYGIFAGSQLFTEQSPLLKGGYEMYELYLRPLLEKVGGGSIA